MKKLINTAFTYSILGMIGGVFYREFTKFNAFDERTSLAFLHLHLFVLGMFFFLILVCLENKYTITNHKNFGKFYIIYNLGMIVTVTMFLCRGVFQVLKTPLSKAFSSSISGVSGVGHILIAVGIVLFFKILRDRACLKP